MALGIFMAAARLGEAFLPLLAGWLADRERRSTFLISISTATLAYLIICKHAQESKDPNAQKLDMGGVTFSAMMMLGFVGSFLLTGNRGFSNPAVHIAMAVGLIFSLIFIEWKGSTLLMPRVQI